ncbi:MAG: hypothetical protein LBB61_06055 [Treponema sp.]|jgi:hypothetical protein|nr:hypothetical protein [Treponema sp.]
MRFPRKEVEFVERSGNLIAVSKSNITVRDVSEAQVTGIEALHTQLKALYEKCRSPAHAALAVRAKNEAKASLIKKERAFIRFLVRNNEKMTDNGREAMSIPIHGKKPAHHPAPDHTNGAMLFWSVSEAPVTNPEELKMGVLITRAPHIMSFSPTERRKIVYMAGRW